MTLSHIAIAAIQEAYILHVRLSRAPASHSLLCGDRALEIVRVGGLRINVPIDPPFALIHVEISLSQYSVAIGYLDLSAI